MVFGPDAETTREVQDVQKGHPARPQRAKRRGVPLRYVEALSDARTKLGAFFNILLGLDPYGLFG
jgi:hypothetical protein